jgi:hypothetical protein
MEKHKYRVQVENTLIVTHFMTIEAEDAASAKRKALELYEAVVEEGEEPEDVEYLESGIGGDTFAEVVCVDGARTDDPERMRLGDDN